MALNKKWIQSQQKNKYEKNDSCIRPVIINYGQCTK
jgi:hypothetical protein